MRMCKQCNIEKEENCDNFNFTRCKSGKTYYLKECRKCYNERIRLKYIKKLGIQSGFGKCRSCKEIKPESEFNKHGTVSGRLAIVPVCKYCAKENRRQSHKKAQAFYRINSRDKKRANQKRYIAKIKNKPSFKIRQNVSRSISNAISKSGNSKNRLSFLKYCGYSISDLMRHLESNFEYWMSCDNYGIYNKKIWDDDNKETWTWQIDHVVPHSDFPYTSMGDDNFKKCWSLSNLRPLSAKQNILDGSSRTRHKKAA